MTKKITVNQKKDAISINVFELNAISVKLLTYAAYDKPSVSNRNGSQYNSIGRKLLVVMKNLLS